MLVSNLKEVIKYQNQADELNKKYSESLSEQEYLSGLVESQELSIDAAQKRYNEQVKLNGAGSQEAIKAKSVLDSQQEELESTRKLLENQKEITNEYGKQISLGDKKTAQANEQINKIGSYGTQAVNSLTELTDMLSNFGIDFGETFSGVVSGLGQAFQGLEQIDITKPMSIITGAVSVVSGIGNAIASIFGGGDNTKEKEIQRQLELVEDLQRAYEKLEEAIDNAYSIDQLNAASDQAESNLKKQAAALEEAIRLEEDKKKTDKDKVEEYRQQLEETYEQLEKLEEQRLQTLGGFGSDEAISSAAQEFADAWLDAYRETGDGLDALNEKWDEYIQNIIAKQLMLKGAEKFLKPIMDYMDKALEDSDITSSEIDRITEMAKEAGEDVNEFWKSLMDSLGVNWLTNGESGGDTLSGLEKGIASASEETVQAVAALLESIRFFVSDENAVIHNIYNTLTMPTEENPFLAELRNQTSLIQSINNTLSKLTRNATSNGLALKVQIV